MFHSQMTVLQTVMDVQPFLGSVTSNSSSEICLESPVSACADGEQQIFLNGCTNVTYTMTYDDGTIIDGSYDGCYDNTSKCVHQRVIIMCVLTLMATVVVLILVHTIFTTWMVI